MVAVEVVSDEWKAPEESFSGGGGGGECSRKHGQSGGRRQSCYRAMK